MKDKLQSYCEILLKEAVNLQTDQILYIKAYIEFSYMVNVLCKTAYGMGASYVEVEYTDKKTEEIRSEYSVKPLLPEYLIEHKIDRIKNDVALLWLERADKPKLSNIIVETDVSANERYRKEKSGYSFQSVKTIVPTREWAEQVFPNDKSNKALEKLWEVVFDIGFVNTDNPLEKWKKHKERIEIRRNYLNNLKLDRLHIFDEKNDFILKLADNHLWIGGFEETDNNIRYMPNFPTEEIFTAPEKYEINGIIYNSRPLVYGDKVIDDFCFKVKNGYIYDYQAEINNEVLDKLFEDENMRYFGEIALLSSDTMISRSDLIFYTTLLDENCSSHMALGRALKCNINCEFDDYENHGINYAKQHVDFMFGRENTNVIAYDEENKRYELIIGGNWVI